MNLQVEAHLTIVLCEQVEHLAGTTDIVVEGSVKNSYILDSMCADILKPGPHLFQALISYRLFSTAYAECTCIETPSGGLQLYKRLVPIEERASLGILQRREIRHPRRSIVMV